jgi:metal-responsive CopG/Arc/MetJ family transcriptional regulator
MPPKTERFEMRLDLEMIERIDNWRRQQSDLPTRAEAIRRLIETALGSKTKLRSKR